MIDPGAEEILNAEFARALVLDTFYDARDQLREDQSALRKIIEQAREEAMSAMTDLLRVDPFNGEEVRRLQWKAQRYEALCDWIRMILGGGEAAEEDMTDEERAETERLIRGEPEQGD